MRITINIEDNKAGFLLELLQSLNYVTIEVEEDELTDELKALLDERIKIYEENPDDLIEWSDVKKQLHKSHI